VTDGAGAPAFCCLVLAPAGPEAEGGKKSFTSSPYFLLVVLVGAIVALHFLKRGLGGGAVAAGPRRSDPALSVAAPSVAGQGTRPSEEPAAGRKVAQDPEVAKLYLELSDFAREMEGRMDTKIAYLKRLVSDAEKVLSDLNGAIARAEALAGGRGGAVPGFSPGPAPEVEAASEPPAGSIEKLPEPLIDVVIDGTTPMGNQGLKDRILSLSGAGKTKEAIAEAVGVPKGEVELVLSLHRASQKGIARNGGKDPKNRIE